MTKEQLQEYCMMFPIAYYAGKPLPLEAADVTTSCANIVNGSIYISLSQVNKMLKNVTAFDASIIRPLVYHEVSHVILTPRNLQNAITHVQWYNPEYGEMHQSSKYDKHSMNVYDIINIFEDERIESVMRNVYMEVNFFKNVCLINEWHGPREPQTIQSAFYDMIRHHSFLSADFKWHALYNRSRKLIEKWCNLRPDSDQDIVNKYADDLFKLYFDFMKAALASPAFMHGIGMKEQQAKEEERRQNEELRKQMYGNAESSNEDANDEDESIDVDDDMQKSDSDSNSESQKVSSKKQDENGEIDIQHPDERNFNDEDRKDEKQDVEDYFNGNPHDDSDDVKQDDADIDFRGKAGSLGQTRALFDEFVFDVQDEKVKQLLMQKLFIKDMHGMQMGAIHKHSGKLDVKAVGRKDWKIFKQPSMFSDGSKIGKKMHLIVVLDQSGSYQHNDYATNMILASLKSAEEHLKAFEFTVIKFGNSYHVCKKNERYSDSHEGTTFSEGLFDQIEKSKRQDCANFVIFLNDGAAWTNWYDDKKPVKDAMKKSLDHNNCVCILDSDAYSTWFTHLKKAKVIVTDSYVSQLSENVCNALGAMLAV